MAGALRWTVCLLLLAAGAMVAGYYCRLSYADALRYSGTDLSNRIGAARTVDQGLDPYTYRRLPDGTLIKRWNEHPYSPPLIWAYVPMSRLHYPQIRRLDFWLEWAAFAVMILAAGAAFGGIEGAAWAGGLFAVVAGQFSWRLHVERGQAYVFLAMLLCGGFSLLVLANRWKKKPFKLALAISASGLFIGAAAVTRPTLGLAVLLLPLCGHWRAALIAGVTAAAIYGCTLMPGNGGYWPGYLRVVDRLEHYYLNPGPPPGANDGLVYTDDPAIEDAYAWPEFWKRLRSRSGNLVANDWLWPWCEQHWGWPGRDGFSSASRAAAVGLAITAAGLIALLWLRGAPSVDRLAVAAAAAVTVDFFVPVRFEYADLLFVLPLAVSLVALRRRSLVLAIFVGGCVVLSREEPTALGVKGSTAWAMRGLTMVLLPAAAVWAVGMIRGGGSTPKDVTRSFARRPLRADEIATA